MAPSAGPNITGPIQEYSTYYYNSLVLHDNRWKYPIEIPYIGQFYQYLESDLYTCQIASRSDVVA